MFSVPTVFVLGAGAGFDINMPIGEKLSSEISRKLNIRYAELGQRLESGDATIAQALRRIAQQRGENFNDWRRAACSVSNGISYTRSIDAYIQTHKDDEKIKICAKLAIVQTILEHEGKCAVALKSDRHEFTNRSQVMKSWLPDFMYVLQDKVSAKDNLANIFDNLTIINFNYDRCIEQFLHKAFCELFRLNDTQAAEYIERLNIFHPYGKVGGLLWQQDNRKVGFGASDYGDVINLSSEIMTFNEKIEEGIEVEKMRKAIADASRLVFLGFHFHQQNMDLIRAAAPANPNRELLVLGTGINRHSPEIEVIDSQIREVLAARGGPWKIVVGSHLDCKQLFAEYGTTLAR